MYQVPLEMICRHDRTAEVCRAAVEEDGWQLENVPEEVKTPELCRKALETEAGFGNDRFRLVQHIPSPEVCMEVLKECSKVCPEELYGVAAGRRWKRKRDSGTTSTGGWSSISRPRRCAWRC